MKRFRIGTLILSLLIPLAVGGVSALLTMQNMAVYSGMNKPPLSPPAWVFPVAWTILYLLMGEASYLVCTSDAPQSQIERSLSLYGVQLALNFLWPIVFFTMRAYLSAFVVLILLWIFAFLTLLSFWGIRRRAGVLLLPYLLWLSFALYLNWGVYSLNG